MESLPYIAMMGFLGFVLLTFALLAAFIVGPTLFVTGKAHNENVEPEQQKSLDLPRQLMISGSVGLLIIALCLLVVVLAFREH